MRVWVILDGLGRVLQRGHGAYLRHTAMEAPRQLGHAERRRNLEVSLITTIIIQHLVVGKEQVKQRLAAATEAKHEQMARVG